MGRSYNLRNTSARKSRTDPDSRKRQSRQANKNREKETNASEPMEASSNSEEIRKKGNEAFKKFKYCAKRPLQKGEKYISLYLFSQTLLNTLLSKGS